MGRDHCFLSANDGKPNRSAGFGRRGGLATMVLLAANSYRRNRHLLRRAFYTGMYITLAWMMVRAALVLLLFCGPFSRAGLAAWVFAATCTVGGDRWGPLRVAPEFCGG